MLPHIFANGWRTRNTSPSAVWHGQGQDETKKWTPQAVKERHRHGGRRVRTCAESWAKNGPSTIIWAMGRPSTRTATPVVRASCILQLALGNVGVSGGGTNIYPAHDNVQAATDVAPMPTRCRLLRPHARRLAALGPLWNIDYDW